MRFKGLVYNHTMVAQRHAVLGKDGQRYEHDDVDSSNRTREELIHAVACCQEWNDQEDEDRKAMHGVRVLVG